MTHFKEPQRKKQTTNKRQNSAQKGKGYKNRNRKGLITW